MENFLLSFLVFLAALGLIIFAPFRRKKYNPIRKVDDGLYRGPRPTSADELKKLGVNTVISLQEGWFERFHDRVGSERRMLEKAGIAFLHVPFGDVFPPDPGELDTVLFLINQRRSAGVYVHCLQAVDRTGLVCASWRVKVRHWSIRDAIEEMDLYGFHVFRYWLLGWRKSLRAYLKGDE